MTSRRRPAGGAVAAADAESARLADEHAAARRVATLVRHGVPPGEVSSAVIEEVDQRFDADRSAVGRFKPDGPATVFVGVGQYTERVPVGTGWELDDILAATAVFRTGRTARADQDRVGPDVSTRSLQWQR